MTKAVRFLLLLAAFGAAAAAAAAAAAPNADDYRGGWRTESGEPHTYEFSIRGHEVRGIYCTWCADGTTLAFIDGTFGADGITFKVTHVNADGTTAYEEKGRAVFDRGKLIVTGTRGAPAGSFARTLIKDPRGPAAGPGIVVMLPERAPIPALPPAAVRPPVPYIQPGPWKTHLTRKDVIGVWIAPGAGAAKQYFFIRRVGEKLRGMVCGPCDNPYTMAALDDFQIHGDTVQFNILHEDWGAGGSGSPTFVRPLTAHVGWNEMRYTNGRPAAPGPFRGASLLGPIPIEATSTNHWSKWPPDAASPGRAAGDGRCHARQQTMRCAPPSSEHGGPNHES